MKEYPLNGHCPYAAMTGVGVRTGQLRTMQHQGQSRSKAIGSILLMCKDHPDFSLDNIQDPAGLANVIKSAIKMRKDELDDEQLQ